MLGTKPRSFARAASALTEEFEFSLKVARETFKKSVMCEGWKKETSKSTLHLQKLAVRKMDWSCA